MTEYLQHNRIRLALHSLRDADGPMLLLLHGLGERSKKQVPVELESWPGPVRALDFTGHGESTVPRGGGYTSELLMADADHALAHLGRATVVGRGIGAYVALLIAGGRPERVRGAILRDGPGFAGGGATSNSTFIPYADLTQTAPPDPLVFGELATDIRPPEYATVFARQAAKFSALKRPISVCASERPAWLLAVIGERGVEVTTLREALDHYASS